MKRETEFYIAVRDLNNIHYKLWATPRYLSGGLKKYFNKSAKQMGFNMTHNGVKLKFYTATKEDIELYASDTSSTYVTLTYGEQWNPLFFVDMSKLRPILKEIKRNYKSLNFSNRLEVMDFNVEKKYIDSIVSCSTKIGEDVPYKREKRINENNIKVGDVIDQWPMSLYKEKFSIVTRISESGYWFSELTVPEEFTDNLELIQKKFNDIKIEDLAFGNYVMCMFPYKTNEKNIIQSTTVKYKRWNRYFNKTDSIRIRIKK